MRSFSILIYKSFFIFRVEKDIRYTIYTLKNTPRGCIKVVFIAHFNYTYIYVLIVDKILVCTYNNSVVS